MKTNWFSNRGRHILVCGLIVSAGISASPLVPRAAAAEGRKDSEGFVNDMKAWREAMTNKFRETWQGLRGKEGAKSSAVATVDLREQNDSYTLRLNVPDRDVAKVEVRLEGDALRIILPAGEKTARYEQTLTLANVAPNATPQIERNEKDDLIVVTVPKSASVAEATPPVPEEKAPGLLPLEAWERDVITRMEEMRREMDRIFEESAKKFGGVAEHKGLFDFPRLDSSLDLQEEGSNYIVRVFLLDQNLDDVNVAVEGRVLRIETKAEKEDKKLRKSQRTRFAQVITLPGAVHEDKMKVEKKEGMLVVTLPKKV